MIYLHHIEIQTATDIESRLEEKLKRMYLDKNQGAKGETRDIEDIAASIRERRLSVRLHNGWQFLTQERAVQLSEPNHFHVMMAD